MWLRASSRSARTIVVSLARLFAMRLSSDLGRYVSHGGGTVKLIVGGKHLGKTRRLVELVKATPQGVLVVSTERERQRVMSEFALDGHQVVRAGAADKVLMGRSPRTRLFVDNADAILMQLLGSFPIDAMSMGEPDAIETLAPPAPGVLQPTNQPRA